MKCQIMFSGKYKKNIRNLASAEFAQKVVNVNGDKTNVGFEYICDRDMDVLGRFCHFLTRGTTFMTFCLLFFFAYQDHFENGFLLQ